MLTCAAWLPLVGSAALSPDPVPGLVSDRQAMQAPGNVRLTGWMGQRIDGSESNRLVKIDVDRLLEGFRQRPGRQEWEGEHIGKWLHAATLAWAHSGDPALRAKLDAAVLELQKCQLPDGYLGTYLPDNYWSSWDVWAHKYNLLGLITYMRHTGNLQPMDTCRRMADLLSATFGDQPGQKDIVASGYHAGLASLSVLEPMVLLYRFTGERRYLDFSYYLLRASEQPKGPKIVSTLLTTGRVNEVGNAKAYEMISCLNGLLELYRTVGDPRLLAACQNAWADIREKRLYITGAASSWEYFQDDHELPNDDRVGETCVTVSWLQFNAQLLRLTGEARFAEELERVVLNQLFGAQSPACDAWGYYVQMEGKKPYSATLTGHCCLSSGPRGVALIPTFAVSTDADGAVVNLYSPGRARLTLADGRAVALDTVTDYPHAGRIQITVTPAAASGSAAAATAGATFAVKLRLPAWSPGATLLVNDEPQPVRPAADGYVALRRAWRAGDVIRLGLDVGPRILLGDHMNAGKAALLYGPLVLAADDTLLPGGFKNLRQLVLPTADLATLAMTAEPAPDALKTGSLAGSAYRIGAGVRHDRGAATTVEPLALRLVPFAEAGGGGGRYQVWLPLAGALRPSVLAAGVGSSNGNPGRADPDFRTKISDGNLFPSDRITAPAAEGPLWFAVTVPEPVTIRRVVFVHGRDMQADGWFDSSVARPAVEIRRTPDGPWIKVGEFADYPATTATIGGALQTVQKNDYKTAASDPAAFAARYAQTLRLAAPETVVAVRVIGTSSQAASRDKSTATVALVCAELEAFVE